MSVSKMSDHQPSPKADQIELDPCAAHDLGARKRVMTDKGAAYQISLHEKRFKEAVSIWRRHSRKALVIVSDTSDTDIIRQHRNLSQNALDELSSTFQQLEGLKENVTEEADQMESIENEHNRLMIDIATRIHDIENQKSEVKSHASSRFSSKVSSRSSKESDTSKVSSAVAREAALKTKLKYIDLESKAKAELEKIQTIKEIEIARAEVTALEGFIDNYDVDIGSKVSLPKYTCNTTEYVKEYVQTHAQMPIEVNAIVTDPTTVTTSLNPVAPTYVPLDMQQTIGHRAPICNTVPPESPTSVVPPGSNVTPDVVSEYDFCPGRTNTNSTEQGLIEFAKSLVDQVSLSRLPPPQPGVFAGDPLSYAGWKSAFHTLIEQRQIPPSERIHYLKRYVAGPVREVIEGYLLLASDEAYEEAKKTLDSRYGDPFVIANAFRDKLEKWPKIMPRDGSGLQRFADFLHQCHIAMHSIGCLNVLNDDRENRKLLTKLPDWMVSRWGRIVSRSKDEKGVFPPFKEFMEFVMNEAKIACDPVTSLQSLKSVVEDSRLPKPSRRQDTRSTGSRALLSEAAENKGNLENTTSSISCILCQKSHDLDNCKVFLQKPLSDRKSFARDKRLCFACLQCNHISRRCRQRKKCNVCGKFHPSSLHGDPGKPQSAENIKVLAVSQSNSESSHDVHASHNGAVSQGGGSIASKCSTIVPVYVSHCDDPDNERLVYALLDTHKSDTTFVLDATCDALGVTGADVKLCLSTMHAENKIVPSRKIRGLAVRGFDSEIKISLPDTYTRNIMPADRSHVPTPDMARVWTHLEHIAEHLVPLRDCEIGLLIGYNCPRALVPREVIASSHGDGPYGQKTDLGWSIVGVIDPRCCEDDSIGMSHRVLAREVTAPLKCDSSRPSTVLFSLRTSVKEVITDDVLGMMERDFTDVGVDGAGMSQQDKRFIATLSEGIHFQDGQYEMPLPFKDKEPCLPDNKSAALGRLKSLRRKLEREETFRLHYCEFMHDLLNRGHAERVSESDPYENGRAWYIPHHGVYHPQKPDKIRVVFDCSARFQGSSLNAHLLQGPDLTNRLVGVLCRFRKEPVALMCDVEKMFYQFKVNREHRDYLRFLWWNTEDFSKEPVVYRMTVHLFGATSSPGCANFGLKRAADDNQEEFGPDVADFIRRDFYVDDGLKSVPTVKEAVSLVDRSKALCGKAGIRLHKFVSNIKNVISHLEPEDRAKDLKDVDIILDKLPIERALGIHWCLESDTFQFRLTLKDRPLTRRGILSTVCSMYDPLGFIGPVVLIGKQILQEMCADRADWDDPLPEHLRAKWSLWRSDLSGLASISVQRCVKPADFSKVDVAEIHHFSDASTTGYGQCSYLRLVNDAGQVHCALLMGKSRVVPLKPITIPRLELTASVLSVKTGSLLEQELDYEHLSHVYWTDSKVVLGYLSNEARRFHVFVANRVQQIRNRTDPSQWKYVSSDDNPADIASRGATTKELADDSSWFMGPKFLWQGELPAASSEDIQVNPEDPEVKRGQSFATGTEPVVFSSLVERLQYFSDWHRAKRAVAGCLRFIDKLRARTVKKPAQVHSIGYLRAHCLPQYQHVTVSELQRAETEIIKSVQSVNFAHEIKNLSAKKIIGIPSSRKEQSTRHNVLRCNSQLYKLDPFLSHDGILRVGGQIQKSEMLDMVKFRVVLPRKGHITDLIIRHFHSRVQHQGRGMTTHEIRCNGFWVIGCSSAVSSAISKCVACRRIRSSTQTQKMADLPTDRLEPSPPFTYCAVDLFGPWYIKEGRKEMKRYGVLFTCLTCRAVHVETSNTLSTDSFINCLRRFLAIRGPIRQMRSDRGTNFVGAENELKAALAGLDEDAVKQFLLKENCDLFDFKMNVPSASHMGGVWERQIRSVRNVMANLLYKHGTQLDDESLRTFLCEAAAIVNSRPLTVDNINDPLSSPPLSPNLLLTMKSSVVLPPPGTFQKPDLYSRKRWRRTQYLVNEFWIRWRAEFIQNLQVRSKWNSIRRNISVGDIVLLKDDQEPRNSWRLCRVVEVHIDDDGLVRKTKLAVGTSSLNSKGERITSTLIVSRTTSS